MAIQIALCYSKKCEIELLKKGFKKEEVYIKPVNGGGGVTQRQIAIGDQDFFSMTNRPYQFTTTSWWGVGID